MRAFVVDHRDRDVLEGAMEFADHHMTPVIEGLILALVDKHRPELKNCTLEGVNFDYSRRQWKIVVSHRSLPSVPLGEELPEEPLVRRLDPATAS